MVRWYLPAHGPFAVVIRILPALVVFVVHQLPSWPVSKSSRKGKSTGGSVVAEASLEYSESPYELNALIR